MGCARMPRTLQKPKEESKLEIQCVWEHNGEDSLLYAADLPGAYARGRSQEETLQKMQQELPQFLRWTGSVVPPEDLTPVIVQEKASALCIADADSDVLFESERLPLTAEDYAVQKVLALRSAADFLALYRSIPDPDQSVLPPRETFYGAVPRTAREMYEHTKNVNSYYFREIGIAADNEGDIFSCRERGFLLLERQPDYLQNKVFLGSYEEKWSLRKVLRRFIWHDRIHAKAMARMATKTFGAGRFCDPFGFGIG